jgi:hypothetical protein
MDPTSGILRRLKSIVVADVNKRIGVHVVRPVKGLALIRLHAELAQVAVNNVNDALKSVGVVEAPMK